MYCETHRPNTILIRIKIDLKKDKQIYHNITLKIAYCTICVYQFIDIINPNVIISIVFILCME